MTDAVQVGLIAAVAPSVVAAVGVYLAFQTHRVAKAGLDKTGSVETKVVGVDTKVDGRFTEMFEALMKLTRESSFSDGVAAANAASGAVQEAKDIAAEIKSRKN